MQQNRRATVVGPGVWDLKLLVEKAARAANKHVCSWGGDALGGGGPNVAAQMRRLGADVELVMLTGDHRFRPILEDLAADTRLKFISEKLLPHTWLSVLMGEDCFPTRPGLVEKALPESIRGRVADSDLTVVAQ